MLTGGGMKQKILFILFLSVFAVGCKQGFAPIDQQPISLKTGDPEFDKRFDLGQVEESAQVAEKMAQSTEVALEKISVDLNIRNSDISLFRIGKLKKKLKKIEQNLSDSFGNLNFNLQSLRDKLDMVRQEIQDRIAQLDPNDPRQARVIERAQRLLDKMDLLEMKLDGLVDKIHSLLDRLSDRLDRVIEKVTSKLGIAGIPVQIILEEMKNELIARLEDKLTQIIGG
ncbi:MAG: hypothetical protein D6797_09205 [Bdellovibrio sp.]|nr:MAG: hypothetical protein D6797_09205 [Bdellovibrio sp.]